MIKTNSTQHRDREGALLPMVAECNTPSCSKALPLRPTNEKQALSLSTACVPPDWAEDYLLNRKWSVEGIKTYCPEHTITLDEEFLDEEIIDEEDGRIADFLNEFTMPCDDTRGVNYAELFENYKRWERKIGRGAYGKHAFGRAIRAEGLVMKSKSFWVDGKSSSAYMVFGIEYRPEYRKPEPEPEPVDPRGAKQLRKALAAARAELAEARLEIARGMVMVTELCDVICELAEKSDTKEEYRELAHRVIVGVNTNMTTTDGQEATDD